MTHASLFSGIGGPDLAAEWMGWQNLFHCEINEFGRKILEYYWPKAKSYDDITKTDFTIWRGKIDVLTGRFPCQPYSVAGKRLGKEDDRHLWPEMLRAIREIRPKWVVGENVFGIVNWNGGMVFNEVQADLEAQGYEVQPYVLPAVSVNAPHRRDRVWFVASNANNNGHELRGFGKDRSAPGAGKIEGDQRQRLRNDGRGISEPGITPDPLGYGGRRLRNEGKTPGPRESNELPGSERGFQDEKRNVSNADNARPQGWKFNETLNSDRTERTGENKGQPHQSITEFHQNNDWQNFPTQPPICGGNDGFPAELDGITFSKWRNESIKSYGRAHV